MVHRGLTIELYAVHLQTKCIALTSIVMSKAQNMTDAINFDRKKYLELKRQYQQAKAKKLASFTFEGHELLVTYAKYVVEYLESKFEE